jgi:uncharacterized protein DUF3182
MASKENLMNQAFTEVVCHPVRIGNKAGHERATLEWTGREVARLLSIEYGGAADPGVTSPSGRHRFHVPDDTLTRLQAEAIGIERDDELLGGIVPFAFVATKVISHPLLRSDGKAPEGWCEPLGEALKEATLPGHAAFDRAEAIEAFGRLRSMGPVRLKLPEGIGGLGQWLVHDAEALKQRLAALDEGNLALHGVVLELHLDDARTFSVGQVSLDGQRIAYHGTQCTVRDAAGREVYGGSALWVIRGDLDDLLAEPLQPRVREAVMKARLYDRLVTRAYPDMRASRRNYDLVYGRTCENGDMVGVLEQSWRIGGATPAELAAFDYLRTHTSVHAVRASTGELHDAQPPPPGAQVFYTAVPDIDGPRCKYRTCISADE